MGLGTPEGVIVWTSPCGRYVIKQYPNETKRLHKGKHDYILSSPAGWLSKSVWSPSKEALIAHVRRMTTPYKP
jgi:hypothetical protein